MVESLASTVLDCSYVFPPSSFPMEFFFFSRSKLSCILLEPERDSQWGFISIGASLIGILFYIVVYIFFALTSLFSLDLTGSIPYHWGSINTWLYLVLVTYLAYAPPILFNLYMRCFCSCLTRKSAPAAITAWEISICFNEDWRLLKVCTNPEMILRRIWLFERNAGFSGGHTQRIRRKQHLCSKLSDLLCLAEFTSLQFNKTPLPCKFRQIEHTLLQRYQILDI